MTDKPANLSGIAAVLAALYGASEIHKLHDAVIEVVAKDPRVAVDELELVRVCFDEQYQWHFNLFMDSVPDETISRHDLIALHQETERYGHLHARVLELCQIRANGIDWADKEVVVEKT